MSETPLEVKAEKARKAYRDLHDATKDECERHQQLRKNADEQFNQILALLEEPERLAQLVNSKLKHLLASIPMQPSNDKRMLICVVHSLQNTALQLTQRRCDVEDSVYRDIPLGLELLSGNTHISLACISVYLAKKKVFDSKLSFKVWLADHRGRIVNGSLFRGANNPDTPIEVEGSTRQTFQLSASGKASCVVHIQNGVSSHTTTNVTLDKSAMQRFRLAVQLNVDEDTWKSTLIKLGEENIQLPVLFTRPFTITSTRNKRKRH